MKRSAKASRELGDPHDRSEGRCDANRTVVGGGELEEAHGVPAGSS
jgi:hypothetical protein